MTEEKLYSTLAENHNKPEVDLLKDEELELTPTYPELNKYGEEYYISQKKEARDMILDSWSEEELNYEIFYELQQYHILEFDTSRTVYENKYIKDKYYKGNFFWDKEAISEIPIENKEELKKLLLPKENITYEEAEKILRQDPNFLISAMTVITNNYLNKVLELEYKQHLRVNIPESRSILPVLFTREEETLFLTGLFLLREFNEKIREENDGKGDLYIEELIKDTKDVIIRFNQLLVALNAHKYKRNQTWDDAMREGEGGLNRALQDYDIDLGYKLSTYATWWLRQRILRANSNKGNTIRIPVRLGERLYAIGKKAKENRMENPNLTEEEAFNQVLEGYSEIEKKNILAARKVLNPASLDEKIGETDDENSALLINRIESDSISPEEEIRLIDEKEAVEKILDLANLNDREVRILKLRFGIEDGYEYTLEEVGEIFGVTRERIRQIEKKAMRKISRLPGIEKFRLL